MVEIFLISHEDVSVILVTECGINIRNSEKCIYIFVKKGGGCRSIWEKISKKIEELKTEKILILTDMLVERLQILLLQI